MEEEPPPPIFFHHFLEETPFFKVEENDLEAVQKQQNNDDVFYGRYSVDESCEMISLVLSRLSNSNKSLEIYQLSKLFGFNHGKETFDWKEICDHMKRTKESVTRHWTRIIVPALRDGDQVNRKFEWQIELLEILLQDSKVTCRKDIDWRKIQMEHFKDLTTLELRTFIGNIIQVGKRAQNEDSNPVDMRTLLSKRLANLRMGWIGKTNSKDKLRKYAILLSNHYEMHKSRLIDGIKIGNAGEEDSIVKQEGVKINISAPDTMSEWMSEFMRQNPNNFLDNHNSLDRDKDPLSLGPETLTIEESYSLNQLNPENQPAKPRESDVYVDIADEAKSSVPKEWINKLRNLAENLSSMSREIMHMIDSNEQKVETEGMVDVRMQ